MAIDDRVAFDAASSQAFERAYPLTPDLYVKVIDGLVMLRIDKGLLLEGGPNRRVIAGDDTIDDILKVTALLDGSRTLKDVLLLSGLSYEAAWRVISLLRVSDFIEYDKHALNGDSGSSRGTRAAWSFLARMTNNTGQYTSTVQMRTALDSAAVLILARGPLCDRIRSDIVACGVGSALTADYRHGNLEAGIAEVAGTARSLVIAIDDHRSDHLLASIERLCRQYNVPMLRSARRDATIEIGPAFYADSTACFECYARSNGAAPTSESSGQSGPLDDCLAAMTVDEALALLGQVRTPASWKTVTSTSLTDFRETKSLLLPFPDCSLCGTLFPSSTEADDAAAFEFDLRIWPRLMGSEKSMKMQYAPAIRELMTQRTVFAGHPSYALPAPADAVQSEPLTPATVDMPLTDSALATLLSHVAGRKGHGPGTQTRRWAPSGGNLASVRLYMVPLGVDLGAGAETLTVYDDVEHRLIAVHSVPISAQQVLGCTNLAVSEPSLVLAFVADVARIAKKYNTFSYRLAHLDAGVAAAQLAVVTSALRLEVAFASAWTDDLGKLLDLRSGQEFVSAVALIAPEGGTTCR